MEEPAFVGCLVPSRLIGGFGAFQTEEGKTSRNDRLLAVAANSRNQRDVQTLLTGINTQMVSDWALAHWYSVTHR
jgi:hypothetical protein